MSLCLFRHGRFQVELYITKPNAIVPPHTHPGIDSCFTYITGNLKINLANQEKSIYDVKQNQTSKMFGSHEVHTLFGSTVSSPPGVPHWLDVGPEGGAFLSFEHWKEQDPTSVTIVWEGEPVGECHEKLLNEKKV
jgi:quercetin dioxygenase-like cupin family protein